jgi:hypothetical protein
MRALKDLPVPSFFSITGDHDFLSALYFYFEPFLAAQVGGIDAVGFFAMRPSRPAFSAAAKKSMPLTDQIPCFAGYGRYP